MYQLNETILKENLNYFLCSYGEDVSAVLYDEKFQPETFTVYEKMTGASIIYFNDVSFEEWCRGLIVDQIYKLEDLPEKDLFVDKIIENTMFLLSYEINNEPLAKEIYNQEFVDIVRRVMTYTIHGECTDDVYTAKSFNELSLRIMPDVIKQVITYHVDLKELFLISVASGMMGLDLKGAPAASSNYANAGIPMKKYFDMPHDEAGAEILQELIRVADHSDTPVFYWDFFIDSVKKASHIVWMTDDYIESFFDLVIIGKIIELNPSLCVEIIPKNGRYGNDLSWTDLEVLLNLSVFDHLAPYIKNGQITINRYGAQMGAANLRKLSKSCVDSIMKADFTVSKGCRIHEMIQGGINARLFSSYIITRELSQLATGFSSEKTPILLLYAEPGEYLFWGTKRYNTDNCFNNNKACGRECCSTIKDHEYRKALTDPDKIAAEYDNLCRCRSHFSESNRAVCQELQLLEKKTAK